MFGVGIPDGGGMYIALLAYCLAVSVCLKFSAAVISRYGWQDWTVPRVRLLWPLITLLILVLTILLIVAMAWLRPPALLAQVISAGVFVSGVGAVFYLLVSEHQRWRELNGRRMGAAAVLSLISIGLAAGLLAVFLIAKFVALTALIVLTIVTGKIASSATS